MFNQRVGRALDRPVPARRAQHAPHERRLAGCPRSPCSVTTMPPASAGAIAAPTLRWRRRRQGEAFATVDTGSDILRSITALRYATGDGRSSSSRRRHATGRHWRPRSRRGAANWASRQVGHQRHRAVRRRGASAALARRRAPRHDGLHGAPRGEARAPCGTGAGDRPRDHRAHELLARRGRRCRRTCLPTRDRAYVARYALGRDYHKVLRARLQRLADRIADGDRRLRLPRVHRQRAGARSGARGQGGTRLARQAHAAARRATWGRISSWARSTPTCRCR